MDDIAVRLVADGEDPADPAAAGVLVEAGAAGGPGATPPLH